MQIVWLWHWVVVKRKNITQIRMRNDYDKEMITNKQKLLNKR